MALFSVWTAAKLAMPPALAPHAAQADARTPQGDPARWKVSADVEALTWNPHDPTCFLVSSEDGIVAHFDARKGAGAACELG